MAYLGIAPGVDDDENNSAKQTKLVRTQTILCEFRDALGYDKWSRFERGWDKLGHFQSMVELGNQVDGITVENEELLSIVLWNCNLHGQLPPSIAELSELRVLYLPDNNLGGALPAHIGSASVLPNLRVLRVEGNEHLGGTVDREFLSRCDECNVTKCQPNWSDNPMLNPFLSGVSLSSNDIAQIFCFSPKQVVGVDRIQGTVAFLYPMGSKNNTGSESDQKEMGKLYMQHTWHLQSLWKEQGSHGTFHAWLTQNNTEWCLWQKTWLTELRNINTGCLFVFVTDSFKLKFQSRRYIDGERNWEGKMLTGLGVCKEQDFNPAYGFDHEGWGFAPGTVTHAVSLLDWERRMIESVSKTNKLRTVFMNREGAQVQH